MLGRRQVPRHEKRRALFPIKEATTPNADLSAPLSSSRLRQQHRCASTEGPLSLARVRYCVVLLQGSGGGGTPARGRFGPLYPCAVGLPAVEPFSAALCGQRAVPATWLPLCELPQTPTQSVDDGPPPPCAAETIMHRYVQRAGVCTT